MLESVVTSAHNIDYSVLDELNCAQSELSFNLKVFLNSLEMLAQHWGVVKKEKYAHRIAVHGQLDVFINELPRCINDGKLFNIKTFVLSCKTPYMKTKDDTKVFISKEYSNAAGKLHLIFYTILNIVVKELAPRLEEINKNANKGSILAFFKTIFTSGDDQLFHPLFMEPALLRKIKRQIRLFDLCMRNFEQTFIAMI